MKYAPITSIDVESSFSTYIYIIIPSDNKVIFTTANIEQYTVFNSFLNLN